MYTSETYKNPFWAENSGFMRGRDPLGIQNSSIATYSRLLPGMTNLTSRLRYFGFYSWLLNEYDKKTKNDDELSVEYHYNFIRRAELTIACLMINKIPNELGIVGSDFPSRDKNIKDGAGNYNIAKGADKFKKTPKGSVYWDFRSGALGQYYAGSLISLNLIEYNNNFFIIREEGKKLALAFQDSITEQARVLFLSILESGNLMKDQINELIDPFSLSNIMPYSNEWNYYKDLLFSNDGESYKNSKGIIPTQRKETIVHYLSFFNEEMNSSFDQDFLKLHYKLNLINPSLDASFGWYYFYMNEMLHYSIETVFWGMLNELDGKIEPINDFIAELCSNTVKAACDDYLKNEDQTIIDLLDELKSFSTFDELEQLIRSIKSPNEAISAIVLAFKIIFIIYIENNNKREKILNYEKTNFLSDKKGRTSEVFENHIVRKQNYSFKEYVVIFIKEMINDHISTAYRKMGDGESNLLKFIIEDNMITHIQTMYPKFTSPRLRTLHSLFIDLQLIDNKNKLSELGVLLLNEFNNKT